MVQDAIIYKSTQWIECEKTLGFSTQSMVNVCFRPSYGFYFFGLGLGHVSCFPIAHGQFFDYPQGKMQIVRGEMTINPSTPQALDYDAKFDQFCHVKWQVAEGLWFQQVFAILFQEFGTKKPMGPLLMFFDYIPPYKYNKITKAKCADNHND